MTISRHDLNESEASFLWAVSHFGGGEALLGYLQPKAQGVMGPKLRALARLGEEERAQILEAWALADKISCESYAKTGWMTGELWRDASDYSLQKLSLVPAQALPGRMIEIGVFQLAAIVRQQDRRQLIRTRRELGGEMMAFLDVCLASTRDVSKGEEVRIREVWIVLSRRFEAVEQRLLHLGMYFVACAAGTRFRRQITKVSDLLGGNLGRVFLGYYLGSLRSSRDDLEEIAQIALDELGVITQRGAGV